MAHDPVAAALRQAGALLARGKLVHSYPHSWRSKAPLIFRATPNWFIRLDGPERIREKALDAIAATHFVPEAGRTRLGSMVASRPDWCISRQRAWGVPITVFVDKRSGEPLRDPAVVERIVSAFEAEGADSWYSSPASRFLGNDYNPNDYDQVMDIVDVWFESGSTHAFTLEARKLPWPADLYLEGSDQHRGWFQSSLLEAVGTRGVAPFKAVLTDGFVMDEQGRKMSKSLGNVTAPQEVADKYGVDILRLWVMMSDTSEDLRIGPEILKQQVELYRRLRNTLRWVLGSLAGFDESERVPYAEMPELEKWVLHRIAEFDARVRASVQSFDWTGVYPELHNFCATDLSAFYFDVRKDAIYCDRPDSLRRRAARTVLDHLHRCLTTWLAPVLCFTAEEAWCARFGEEDSVHLQSFAEVPAEWRDDALAARWETIRAIRRRITVPIEEARRANTLGSSLQAAVALPLKPEHEVLLSEDQWAEIAIVSDVRIVSDPEEPAAMISATPGEKCARCWRVLPEVGKQAGHPTLCVRCTDAVESGLVCRG
jgi:isoleucyl-tRNA synthetase